MAAFSPEAFGKYYLVDKIATGGMAEIFKAKTYSHGGFENLLVIKRILSHLGENEDFVAMFIDEAKVSVALQHANIVRIYDFGRLGENYFIAMECVEGKDVRNLLRKLARRQRFLPIELAAGIAHEVARGLDHAHRKTDAHDIPLGIVHRDISPSNILVSYDGEVKIADFGIAKAESNAYETRDGVLKGKFEYMSPEQAMGDSLDRRSDIFGLGIILHEMLTGRRLFKEDNEIRTLERIRAVDVTAPSKINPRVPAALDRIVMKALARREERYQWAGELQQDLQDFLFPSTTDTLRATLSRFMKDAFAEEIVDELERLEDGSSVAEQLHAGAVAEGWEGHTESTLQRPPSRAVWPLMVLGLLLLIVPLTLGTGVAVTLLVGAGSLTEEVARTGGLDVVVLPRARVTLDGSLAGEAEALTLDGLAPGEHLVRLEAQGYESVEATITVSPGQVTRLVRTLVPEKPDAPTVQADAPAPEGARPPVVAFRSSPAGATVLIGGRAIGNTPTTWTQGRPDATYQVEYRLDGHERATATVSGLQGGARTSVDLTLDPVASAPGSLTVALIGGGWAHVYVDDEKLSRPAPLSGQEIAPGRHVIRVENPALGLDYSETVQVVSGQVLTVRARQD